MIKVSASAKDLIQSRRAGAEDHRWFLVIEWRKGEVDNSRGSDGSAVWRREPDKGWEAVLVGYGPEVDASLGEPLLPGVRAIVASTPEHPFPGATITVDGGELRVVVDAV
jgi:hypothetical protein